MQICYVYTYKLYIYEVLLLISTKLQNISSGWHLEVMYGH